VSRWVRGVEVGSWCRGGIVVSRGDPGESRKSQGFESNGRNSSTGKCIGFQMHLNIHYIPRDMQLHPRPYTIYDTYDPFFGIFDRASLFIRTSATMFTPNICHGLHIMHTYELRTKGAEESLKRNSQCGFEVGSRWVRGGTAIPHLCQCGIANPPRHTIPPRHPVRGHFLCRGRTAIPLRTHPCRTTIPL
jgi:hypothetical protein